MKVILDNGHGVNTPGKGSPYSLYGVKPALEFREWRFSREIVKGIDAELRKRGIDTVVLVPEDIDISLSERVRRANAIYRNDKDSFLVSIHVNAAGDGRSWRNANYWSIWTSVGKTQSDVIADYIWLAADKEFVGKQVKSDKTDGDNDCESNFYILRYTACPAVLTENFFQDSIQGVSFLNSDACKRAIIKVHVDGIMEYIKAYNRG